MRDSDLRDHLWGILEAQHIGDADTLMLDELSLAHGSTRIDLAVINGEIQGYELKSERDTLERLPKQCELYGKVLDRVTLVVSESHFASAHAQIPDWWGITVATMHSKKVRAENFRPALRNERQDAVSIAELLWRDEAMATLESLGAAQGVRSKPRRFVYARLAEVLDLDHLRGIVRRTLKDRHNWRADRRQIQCGD